MGYDLRGMSARRDWKKREMVSRSRKEKKRKKGLKISFIIEKKKRDEQLTVKAPGTEIRTTFLSFHSSVDNVIAEQVFYCQGL